MEYQDDVVEMLKTIIARKYYEGAGIIMARKGAKRVCPACDGRGWHETCEDTERVHEADHQHR